MVLLSHQSSIDVCFTFFTQLYPLFDTPHVDTLLNFINGRLHNIQKNYNQSEGMMIGLLLRVLGNQVPRVQQIGFSSFTSTEEDRRYFEDLLFLVRVSRSTAAVTIYEFLMACS